MPSADVGIKVSKKDVIAAMAKKPPAIAELVRLMGESDYTQRRNRANLSAHIAYAKRKAAKEG